MWQEKPEVAWPQARQGAREARLAHRHSHCPSQPRLHGPSDARVVKTAETPRSSVGRPRDTSASRTHSWAAPIDSSRMLLMYALSDSSMSEEHLHFRVLPLTADGLCIDRGQPRAPGAAELLEVAVAAFEKLRESAACEERARASHRKASENTCGVHGKPQPLGSKEARKAARVLLKWVSPAHRSTAVSKAQAALRSRTVSSSLTSGSMPEVL